MPDIYQGNEVWDFSLVDPDNRRPVDYAARERLLTGLREEVSASDLFANWQDGRIKLFVTYRILRLRREQPALFARGAYLPIEVEGPLRDCVIAFERWHEEQRLLVIVPRLSSRVGFPPLGEAWQETRLGARAGLALRDIFTGRELSSAEPLLLSKVLAELPVAVLEVEAD